MRSQRTITPALPRQVTEDVAWPELPWHDWRSTAQTLHMFSQVLGKLRLALSPPEPQWGHAALYVTLSGLTTEPMGYGDRVLQVDLDLSDHLLWISESGGSVTGLPLVNRSVAQFYTDVMAMLDQLGVQVELNPMPQEVPDPIPFPEDTERRDYDPLWARQFHRALLSVDRAFARFRAPYRGPHSRVHLFWGGFDLSYTRFSGHPTDPPPGSNLVERGAMDTEQVSFGFWPGSDSSPVPAFFGYAYPRPPHLPDAHVEPAGAHWSPDRGEFLLPYDEVRADSSPPDSVIGFLDGVFRAATAGSQWPAVVR